MEILLWLVPPVLVTVAAMCWVGWVGRDGHGEVDRDVAVERLARAMAKDHRSRLPERPVRPHDRSTGIAVRPRRDGDTRRAS